MNYLLHAKPGFFDEIDDTKFYYVDFVNTFEGYVLNEISLTERNIIIASNDALTEYEYFKHKKIEIDLNLKDFLDLINHYVAELKKLNSFEQTFNFNKDMLFVNVNRLFVNYINSCRIFIDHLDKKLKQKYKETSPEYREFKRAKGHCYDTFFSYRFFYHLRNYVEHFDFPISDIAVEATSEIGKLNGFQGVELSINFDKNLFLNDEILQKKIGNDLKRFNNSFPVIPQVKEFSKAITYLLNTLLSIEKDYYLMHSRVVLDFFNKRQKGNRVEITRFYRGPNKEIAYNMASLRLELIEELATAISQLNANPEEM